MKLIDLNIKNSNKRNVVCSITYNDKTENFKNKLEAAEYIIRTIGVSECNNIMQDNNLHTDDELQTYILTYLTERLESKAETNYQKNINRNLTFYSKNVTVNIKTKTTLNSVDDALLRVLRYCKEDSNIYVVNNKSFTLLGSIDNIKINSTSLNAQKALRTAMLCKLQELTNNSYKDFEEFFRDKAAVLTNYAKAIIATFKLNLPANYSAKDLKSIQVETFTHDKVNYEDVAGFDNEAFNDVLLTYAYKTLINEVLPSGAISSRLVKIQPTFDSNDNVLTNFIRFSVERCREERSITFTNYVAQLFDNDAIQVLEHIQSIDEVPYIISDDDRNAELYINKANIPTSYTGEHTRFDVFTAPYPKDELELMLAWCYTVLHPSCNEHIMLLLQTAGGNGKTNFWRAMLVYWLKKLYGEDLTLKLNQDEIKNKDKREPANSRGITTAALTVVDECKDNVADLIKTYSGSDRISYTSEVKYARAYSTIINTRFLLLSNEQFKIDDASCAFDRRVIVIKHFDFDNIYKKLPNKCKQQDVSEEADYFYLQCKAAYDNIKSKFNSLYEAKESISTIKQNEEELTSNSDFSLIYYNILSSCEKNKQFNCVLITAAELRAKFVYEAEAVNTSVASFFFFKKWLSESHFVKSNYSKNVRRGHKVDLTYFLHDLKKPIVCDTELDVDNNAVSVNAADNVKVNVQYQGIIV